MNSEDFGFVRAITRLLAYKVITVLRGSLCVDYVITILQFKSYNVMIIIIFK